MSLYNQMMGFNKFAPLILRLIGVANPTLIPRFRDAALIKVGDEVRMVILTRTGGSNAPHFTEEHEIFRKFPGFVRDYDDSYDETFHTFEYRAENAGKSTVLTEMAAEETDFRPPLLRFRDLVERMNDPAHANDADVKRAFEVGRQIMGPIFAQLRDGGPEQAAAILDSDHPDMPK